MLHKGEPSKCEAKGGRLSNPVQIEAGLKHGDAGAICGAFGDRYRRTTGGPLVGGVQAHKAVGGDSDGASGASAKSKIKGHSQVGCAVVAGENSFAREGNAPEAAHPTGLDESTFCGSKDACEEHQGK